MALAASRSRRGRGRFMVTDGARLGGIRVHAVVEFDRLIRADQVIQDANLGPALGDGGNRLRSRQIVERQDRRRRGDARERG